MTDTSPGDIARALSALRKKERKTCPNCGKDFEGIGISRYCSHYCAVAGYRYEHRDELNAKRREKYAAQRKGKGRFDDASPSASDSGETDKA